MKNVKQLFEVVAEAVAQNGKNPINSKHWFVDYSGHVNGMTIAFYRNGWSKDCICERITNKVNEDGIQSLYWFIKSRLSS
jgi:citrate lyase alpha subunit